MPKFNVFLLNEYANAYVLTTKKNYSEPKIYDANGDIAKRWYIYFSFRNPKTGMLEKQTPIYGGANKFKTKQERYEVLNAYRKSLKKLLEDGLSPYEDNEKTLEGISAKLVLQTTPIKDENSIAISDAFAMAVKIKQSVLSQTSFPSFNSNVKRYEKWLLAKGFANIIAITKKTVIEYLNEKLLNCNFL